MKSAKYLKNGVEIELNPKPAVDNSKVSTIRDVHCMFDSVNHSMAVREITSYKISNQNEKETNAIFSSKSQA